MELTSEMEKVCLGMRLHVPFWVSFRDPSTSNFHKTFLVPPPTTLYGLIAASLGLGQDDFSKRNQMRFAVGIDEQGEMVETYSKWMKAAEQPKGEDEKKARKAIRDRGLISPDESVWISTPLVRQKLVKPIYTVGILCEAKLAEEISHAISDPFFPLYLGESDDLIDIELLGMEQPKRTDSRLATGVVSGVLAGGVISYLPISFEKEQRKYKLNRWLVTIPSPENAVQVNDNQLYSCFGHTWEFEPEAGEFALC